MSFWDFNWLPDGSTSSQPQPGWQRALGLFGALAGDAGAAMQGDRRDQTHLRDHFAQLQARAGERQMAELLDRVAAGQQPQAEPTAPPSAVASMGANLNEPVSAIPRPTTAPMSPADALLAGAQMQTRGVDTAPLLNYVQLLQALKPRYTYERAGEDLYRIDENGNAVKVAGGSYAPPTGYMWRGHALGYIPGGPADPRRYR